MGLADVRTCPKCGGSWEAPSASSFMTCIRCRILDSHHRAQDDRSPAVVHAAVENPFAEVQAAVEIAVAAERRRCVAIALACAEERKKQAEAQPDVSTPERAQVCQWLRCKESEAMRIMLLIADPSNYGDRGG